MRLPEADAYLPEIEVRGRKAYGIAIVGKRAYVLKLGQVKEEELKKVLRVDEVIEI